MLTPYDTNECAICLIKYNNHCKVSILNCKHIYHTHCIKDWFSRYKVNTCPKCRRVVKIINKKVKKKDIFDMFIGLFNK